MVGETVGLWGGFVATIVMTLVGLWITPDVDPPPTADLLARFDGNGHPVDYETEGLVLHLVYGTIGGLLFALAFPVGSRIVGASATSGLPLDRVLIGLAAGLGYGAVLFAVGIVGWSWAVLGKLSPRQFEANRHLLWVFFIVHVVYGGILGLWVGLGV